VTGSAPATGSGVLRSTDRLPPPAFTPSAFGKSPVKKGVTFNLDNDDDDDDDDDDTSISSPLRDTCRYCTVSLQQKVSQLMVQFIQIIQLEMSV